MSQYNKKQTKDQGRLMLEGLTSFNVSFKFYDFYLVKYIHWNSALEIELVTHIITLY